MPRCACAAMHVRRGRTRRHGFVVRQDMRKSGHTLAAILKAGQWRSPVFLHYLNEAELDKVGRAPLAQPVRWQAHALQGRCLCHSGGQ